MTRSRRTRSRAMAAVKKPFSRLGEFLFDPPGTASIPERPASSGWRGDPLLVFAKDHLGAVSAAVLGVVTTYIVLVAAKGNIDLGLAILSAGGPAAIVGGTVLTLLPFVMPLVTLAALLWLRTLRGGPAGFSGGGLFLSARSLTRR